MMNLITERTPPTLYKLLHHYSGGCLSMMDLTSTWPAYQWIFGNQKTRSTALPWHPDLLSDNRCNSSSNVAEVLVAITGHCPISPIGGNHYHWRKDPSPSPLLYPPGKREPAYLSGDFSSVNSRWPPDLR
ncbi:hypothetical protein AVEN_80907-1 [Araneus ventricosus]|uniref:Uncharacterized protein n=1 Tax=Araneus ventricosus TaxID=182803 RepID=A0A4Y2DPC1_ARAVE|nr:hypothetical protein AVEN_80907-1 [Araneus ventricosus]